MTGVLQHADGGGGEPRCARCGDLAAGPCARCRAPVCGDCCVLTEGGARIWAICFACERRGGKSLRGAWAGFLLWLMLPLGLLALAVAALALLARP